MYNYSGCLKWQKNQLRNPYVCVTRIVTKSRCCMKKRFFAVVLSVMLALSVVPSAFAAEAEGEEPTPIETVSGIEEIVAENTEPTVADTIETVSKETPTIDDADSAEAANPPVTASKVEPVPTAAQPAPVINSVVPSLRGAKISWAYSGEAARYYVFIRRADNSGWKMIGSASGYAFEHAFTPDNTTNIYTVRAVDADGSFISDAAKKVSFRCLAVPTLTAITPVGGGQKISWKPVNGAESYRVYIKSGSSWKTLAETDKTYFNNKNLSSGKAYTYTVRCRDKARNTAISYYLRSGITATYIAQPKITSLTPVNNGVQIAWDAVKGADRYAVFRKTDDGWKRLITTDGVSYTHTGLANDVEYTYTVRCVDKNGAFASSYDKAGSSIRYYDPPVVSSVAPAHKGMLVSWKEVDVFGSYRVYRKAFKGSWQYLGRTAQTSFNDATAEADVPYAYTLRGASESGDVLTGYKDTSVYYRNGKSANGKITVNGTAYTFTNGKFVSGYYTVGKRTYYYNAQGILQKNGIVGSAKEGYTYADKNGVCCTSEEIKLAAEYMMKHGTGSTLKEKCKTGFLYMARNFPYRRSYDRPTNASHLSALAIDLFKNESGNCFRYAAAFACTAKIAGYRVRTVVGTTGNGSPHGWTEVLVGSDWLICDPDAQLPEYGTPAYGAYMMKSHFWGLVPYFKSELTINADGKLIWN